MDNADSDLPKSCTRDEALGILLGLGVFRISPLKENATREERDIHELAISELTISVWDYLHEERDSCADMYAEAKKMELSAEDIALKLAAYNQSKLVLKKASEYQGLFDDEISKGDRSAIRIDITNKSGVMHFRVNSILQWMKTNDIGAHDAYSDSSEKPLKLARSLAPIKPKKINQQIDAIKEEIVSQGEDPMNLPKKVGVDPGVKADVRAVLDGHGLFTAKTSFDNAWEKICEEASAAKKKAERERILNK